MFISMKSRLDLKLGHTGQKLGHKMKDVYTPEGTVLTQSSWIYVKMLVIMKKGKWVMLGQN